MILADFQISDIDALFASYKEWKGIANITEPDFINFLSRSSVDRTIFISIYGTATIIVYGDIVIREVRSK